MTWWIRRDRRKGDETHELQYEASGPDTPRVDYQGTRDAAWRAQQYPALPADFDPRFYQSAHPDLICATHLTGNETLTLIGLLPEGRTAADMQAEFRDEFKERLTNSLGASMRNAGMSNAQARAAAVTRAAEIMGPLAALHEPDMVTGGFEHAEPKHMGQSGVNSAIGGSWNQRERLSSMDDAAGNAVAKGNGSANMNVKLRVCSGK